MTHPPGPPDKPGGRRFADGARLGLTTLTVAPLGRDLGPISRTAAGTAMALAPLIGALLGAAAAGVAIAARALGAPSLVAAVLAIATVVVLTRGLHIDGLADTADGLGSYRDAATALEIMRRPDLGAFGVTAVILVLLAEIAAAAELLARPWPAALTGIVAATAAGRLAIALACRRGVPAARTDGLGALVAGTVGPVALGVAAVLVAVVAVPSVPGRPWQGPVAVVLSLAAAAVVVRHAVRRFGGITGDVLGAACELASAVTYVVTSM